MYRALYLACFTWRVAAVGKVYGARCYSSSECQSNNCQYVSPDSGTTVCCYSDRKESSVWWGAYYCTGVAAVGAKCFSPLNCESGVCHGERCIVGKVDGTWCAVSSECQSNKCHFVSPDSGTAVCCHKNLGVSHIWWGYYYCWGLASAGAKCFNNRNCKSGMCRDERCRLTPCQKDFHVVDNICIPCTFGAVRPAGDNPYGPDTACKSCRSVSISELTFSGKEINLASTDDSDGGSCAGLYCEFWVGEDNVISTSITESSSSWSNLGTVQNNGSRILIMCADSDKGANNVVGFTSFTPQFSNVDAPHVATNFGWKQSFNALPSHITRGKTSFGGMTYQGVTLTCRYQCDEMH